MTPVLTSPLPCTPGWEEAICKAPDLTHVLNLLGPKDLLYIEGSGDSTLAAIHHSVDKAIRYRHHNTSKYTHHIDQAIKLAKDGGYPVLADRLSVLCIPTAPE